MYGWRARIGLIIPSLNVTMEPEFNAMAPAGVSIHATRLLLERGTAEQLEKMAGDTEKAALLLKTADVDIIVYGCTSGSLIRGTGWDREIIAAIENVAGIPATTTSTAVIEAFHELGVKSVAVGTPYITEVNEREKKFFEDHGVRVVHIEGLNYTRGEELHREPSATAYLLGKRVNRPDADCVFISCTDFKTLEVIGLLERDLRKPVVSSNTATMWSALQKLGLRDALEGYGEIMRRL